MITGSGKKDPYLIPTPDSSRREGSGFMNSRFERWRGFPFDAVLITAVLLALNYLFWARIGLSVADLGQLWYGTIQTALGEVPMRDFQSYDPGRYYWGAFWFKILRDDGIMALRFSGFAFQFIGMVLGLSVLRRRVLKTWWTLAAAGLVIWIWLGGHETSRERTLTGRSSRIRLWTDETSCDLATRTPTCGNI